MKKLPNEWLLNFQEIRQLEAGFEINKLQKKECHTYDYDENFVIPKQKVRTIQDLNFAFKQKINF